MGSAAISSPDVIAAPPCRGALRGTGVKDGEGCVKYQHIGLTLRSSAFAKVFYGW
jgi:hypothetical protein